MRQLGSRSVSGKTANVTIALIVERDETAGKPFCFR